jgi:hypothetical protein
MKRQRLIQRLFNMLRGASLLVCLVILALWVRSYWVMDLVRFDVGWSSVPGLRGIGLDVGSRCGSIHVQKYYSSVSGTGQTAMQFARGDPMFWSAPSRVYHWPGRRLMDNPAFVGPAPLGAFSTRYFDVPDAALAASAAAWPAGWFFVTFLRRRRTEYRHQHALCLVCNYDLRAHHPGEKCPECGTLIPAKRQQSALK